MSGAERELLREVFAKYGSEPDLYLMRNTVGVAREIDTRSGRERIIRYGLGAGSPDVVGMLRIPGTNLAAWVGFELKSATGKRSKNQVATQGIWSYRGAIVEPHVDSLTDFGRALSRARDRVSSGLETLVARMNR